VWPDNGNLVVSDPMDLGEALIPCRIREKRETDVVNPQVHDLPK